MRIRFSDPLAGGHEIAVLAVKSVKFLDSLVIAQIDDRPGISGQTVVARIVDNGFRLASTRAVFFRCEILPDDEPDIQQIAPQSR